MDAPEWAGLVCLSKVSRELTGSKGGVSGAANQRTEEKILVLTDVLHAFEKRLEQLSAAQEQPSPKAATGVSTGAKKGERSGPTKRAPKDKPQAAPATSARSRASKGPAPSPVVKKSAATTLRGLMDKKSADGSAPGELALSAKARRKPAPAGKSGAAQTDKTMTTGNAPYLRPGETQIQGHSASQVRRGQVKRDSRG